MASIPAIMDRWTDPHTGEILPPNSCADTPTIPEPLKPTRGHRAAIAELGLRFPCPRDTDPDEYAARMDYLAKDTAHLAVPLLRAACDRAAQSARGMPYASEILLHASAVIEDRQRAIDAATPAAQRHDGSGDPHAVAARRYNRENASAGNPTRWTDAMEMFRIGELGERRATRDDGSVIEPWFKFGDAQSAEPSGWHPPAGDGPALNAAYQRFGAPYVVRGGAILARD